ncbi:MAG: hypothetical protein WBJ10_07640 [Daejeonella sp.]|uniref:hypothetical protein n=1 Tax=Daejeonella sp. TaxID=2805397 RepID=UPI003C7904BD
MRYLIVAKYLKCLSFALAVIVYTNLECSAQTTVADNLKARFSEFTNKAYQEKIFLHTDKSFYNSGDLLWFKAYVVDGSTHKPSDLSKVAYVEILDSLQTPVLQAKISVKNGFGNGSFVLPSSLNSGNYKIRAYTNWMRNYSADYYFEELISIVNYDKSLPYHSTPTSFVPDIQFFPEGGNLVENLMSKVAFKVNAPDTRAFIVSGFIIDQNNDTLLRFQPSGNGIGEFNFSPESGKQYRSVLLINNQKFTRELPQILSAGYVMNVRENNPEKVQIRVDQTADLGGGTIYLLVHTRQKLKIVVSAAFKGNTLTFNIKKDLLGDGISHLTIFDHNKRPVAERLYFKHPKNKLNLQARPSSNQLGLRKKIDIDITSIDPAGKALPAHVSVAVYRQDSLPSFTHQQILTYLWLSSDLKGPINNADQYLRDESPASNKALDQLMLTQGWRRFNWDQIISDKEASFTFIPEYQGHIINGTLVNTQNGLPANGIGTYLSIPGSRVQVYQGKSDTQGRISFFTKDLYGSNEAVISNNFAVDSIYRLNIINPFSESFSEKRIPPLSLNQASSQRLNTYYINKQVRDIYAQRSNRFYSPAIDSTAFYGTADISYHLDDYTRFPTMEEVLKEYILEISLLQRQKKAFIRASMSDQKGFYDQAAFLMVDGVPFFDADKIVAFDPLKIKTIDIVNHRYLLNEKVVEGIINFKSYKSDLAGFEIDPRSVVLDYEGLQLKREFYSPIYATETELKSRLPDFRDLLFWESDVQTDESGKAKLSFYTSDQEGNYKIIIQGISNSGLAGSGHGSFMVK